MIAVLLLVITLIHLDRFDLNSLFGVFWLCAYVLVPLLLAWALARPAERPQLSPCRWRGGCRMRFAGC